MVQGALVVLVVVAAPLVVVVEAAAAGTMTPQAVVPPSLGTLTPWYGLACCWEEPCCPLHTTASLV